MRELQVCHSNPPSKVICSISNIFLVASFIQLDIDMNDTSLNRIPYIFQDFSEILHLIDVQTLEAGNVDV